MSRRGDIEREIRHNCEKIDDYRSEISDLQEKAEIIKEKERRIREEVYKPVRTYDMTHGDILGDILIGKLKNIRKQSVSEQQMG